MLEDNATVVWRSVWRWLLVWGVLIGLGVAPTVPALIAWVGGAFTTTLEVVLALALAAATGVALALGWLLQRYRKRMTETAAALMKGLGPNEWLPKVGDLASVQLSDEDLEAALETAIKIARTELGHDAEVWLQWIDLLPHVEPNFYATGKTAHKTIRIASTAPSVDQTAVFRRERGYQPPGKNATPWRGDHTWRELIRQSWLRERPFIGAVSLWPHSVDDADGGGWRIRYIRTGGEIVEPNRAYHLKDGELVDETK